VHTPTTAESSLDHGILLLGNSPATAKLRIDIETAAHSDAKVLIVGETGVGKEVAARLVHLGGVRRYRACVAVNCAGVPDALLESELFGHVRGSFTGAYRDQRGLASTADGGTLFLDEIGEMSPRMQGVLLRFLETGEIHRLGADRSDTRVDVRVIAATNRNLSARIASGDFREDLFYRLNVVHLTIPPLRERTEDIVPLFTHYLSHYCRIQKSETPLLLPSTEELLLVYRWPGNVRELKNLAERIAVHHIAGAVTPETLPAELREAAAKSSRVPVSTTVMTSSLVVDAAWDKMMLDGWSFWTVVRPLFLNRELTRKDVREIIKRGLIHTHGNYRRLIELFHLPPEDYKRFLAFLYQHDCHLPFHPFRHHRPTVRNMEADVTLR
jgi:DNA-binding NtrC family response regulator